jgi:hypothetical protein
LAFTFQSFSDNRREEDQCVRAAIGGHPPIVGGGARCVKAAYLSSVLAAWRLFNVDRKALRRLAVGSAAKLEQDDVFVGKLRAQGVE